MVFFVGKEFAPRSLYNTIWKSTIISRERANSFTCCKSRYQVCLDSPCVLFIFEYSPYIHPTDKGKGASYELERGINWNTFKSITATTVHTVSSWTDSSSARRNNANKIKTKNLNTTIASRKINLAYRCSVL